MWALHWAKRHTPVLTTILHQRPSVCSVLYVPSCFSETSSWTPTQICPVREISSCDRITSRRSLSTQPMMFDLMKRRYSVSVERPHMIIIIIIIIRSRRQQRSVASTQSGHDDEPWTIQHECWRVYRHRSAGFMNGAGVLAVAANQDQNGSRFLLMRPVIMHGELACGHRVSPHGRTMSFVSRQWHPEHREGRSGITTINYDVQAANPTDRRERN